MMLANYNSDSGSDSESDKAGPSRPPPPPARSALPSTLSSSAPSAKAAPGKAKRKAPVKITLDLPRSGTAAQGGEEEDEGDEDESASVKKPKFGSKGKGSSALLNMLPPPKRKVTIGQGAKSSLMVNKAMATSRLPPPPPSGLPELSDIRPTDDDDDEEEGMGKAGMMLPPSLGRGKSKGKPAEPALDLFGLSSSSAPTPSSSSSKAKTAIPPTISSAPAAPDFIPPPPTAEDPYPGYYQTPSGEWKAYDPEYYATFFSETPAVKLQGEVDETDGRVGRHWDEYNTKGAELRDVDVGEGLKAARAEEERKKLMQKPKLSQDEFEYQTIGQTKGLAAQRHQLTSLLQTAYSSREEMEERIAQNKKNMRLAGQKYGF